MKKKTIALILSCVLVLGCAIGGTFAWLTAKTGPLVNTFTVGNVNIDLSETTTNYKMVPGKDISKDPKVTVKVNSEACWLFVKIDESTNAKFSDYMTYGVADGWTAVTGQTGVYYRIVDATSADIDYPVLKDNKVSVKSGVTKGMMDGLNEANYPKLTFTAYAVQKDGFNTAEDAWAEAIK